MDWAAYIAWFFGGALLTNAVPHLVAGLQGKPFQSPFARPPGKGLSSSTVNVLWGWFNIALGYVLLAHVGQFDIHDWRDAGVVALGGILISLQLATHFGALHGGNKP